MEAIPDHLLLLHVVELVQVLSQEVGGTCHYIIVWVIICDMLIHVHPLLLSPGLQVFIVLSDKVFGVHLLLFLFLLHLFVLRLVLLLLLLLGLQGPRLFELGSLGPLDIFFIELVFRHVLILLLFLHRHVIGVVLGLAIVLDFVLICVIFVVNLICGKLTLDHLGLLVVENVFSCHVMIVGLWPLLVLLVDFIRDHLRVFNLLLCRVFFLLLSSLLLLLLLPLLLLPPLELLRHLEKKIGAAGIGLAHLVVVLGCLVLFVLWLLLLVLHGLVLSLEVGLFLLFLILLVFVLLLLGLDLIVIKDGLVRLLLDIVDFLILIVVHLLVFFLISSLFLFELGVNFIRVLFISVLILLTLVVSLFRLSLFFDLLVLFRQD